MGTFALRCNGIVISIVKRTRPFGIQMKSISSLRNGLQTSLHKAEKFVDFPTSSARWQSLFGNETVDIDALTTHLAGTGHPLLKTVTDLAEDECYSSRTGGLWVLLVSKGTNQIGNLVEEKHGMVDQSGILVKQRKLAEITETIKISSGLTEMLEGASLDLDEESRQDVGWEEYTLKCNGSLVGASCQAAVTLSGHSEKMQADMREFGKCVGMVQTMFADIKAIENGENSKVNETNSVISLVRDSNRSVSEALNRSNARDVYQSHVEIVMDETGWTEILDRARTKLGDYCNRARRLTDSFSAAETRDIVLDILSHFDQVE